MGIQGLLPLLKSIMVPIHIKDLEGCSVAVDTYSWLHKGALSCSRELCKGLPTSRHIEYCMHRVNLLRHYGVKPVLVFDGGLLPMKLEQENKRARSRKENLVRALEHEANGNSSGAYECYQKAVDISPSIAHELIQVLKQENVHYVVAPYEADAQMTFLAVTKQVDAVITEDSDLIPFGCPRIIFKMDKYGHGVEFQASMLHENKELNFVGFSNQMLLEMCIFSGCDYLPSLPGMGLKRAHALIAKFKSHERVIKHLKYSTVSVPPFYEESFKKAILTFKHQRVYDLKAEDIVHLSHIADNLGEDSDFLGPSIPQHIAQGIAQGSLDPFTQMPFQAENVTPKLVVNDVPHPKSFKPENLKKKLDLPVQKNLLTKYFCFASLEAKRKFRAPRTSPKCPSSTDDSSSTPEEDVIVLEASSSEAIDLLASSCFSQKSEDASPADGYAENGWARKVAENSESANDGHQKNAGEEAARPKTESVKVIVRSKYFVNKQRDKDLEGSIQTRPCLNDCTVIGQRKDVKTVISESRECREKEGPRATVKGLPDSITGEAEGTADIEMWKFDSAAIRRNSYLEGITRKRKCFSEVNLQKVKFSPKHMRLEENSSGFCEASNGETFSENKDESKFGSNISHISRYSEIAEKSVERFVSAISSFRYSGSGSGSRASGLRAPFKDIQNSCPPRGPSLKPDFSQFSYMPNNRNHTKSGLRRLDSETK